MASSLPRHRRGPRGARLRAGQAACSPSAPGGPPTPEPGSGLRDQAYDIGGPLLRSDFRGARRGPHRVHSAWILPLKASSFWLKGLFSNEGSVSALEQTCYVGLEDSVSSWSSHRGSAETNLPASTRTQVPSLALLSELRIQHCRELWCRSQMRLGSRVAVAVVLLAAVAPIPPQPGNLHVPPVRP